MTVTTIANTKAKFKFRSMPFIRRKPLFVYHGTRASLDLIKQGIKFDSDFLREEMKKVCADLGVSFDEWKVSKNRYHYRSGAPIVARLDDHVGRGRIWVTHSFWNAVSYSQGNPELLADAIQSIYQYANPRRWSAKFFVDMDEYTYKRLRMLGTRKVLLLDNSHEAVNVVAGINRQAKGKVIPLDAVVRIYEVSEDAQSIEVIHK